MKKQERYDKINELAEILINMDLETALRFYINTPMYDKGAEIETFCPFHDDVKLGSFKINIRKGVASCFSCNISFGNIISFLMKLHGIKRNEAVLKAATDFNLISEDERQLLSGEKEAPVYQKIKINNNLNIKKRDIIEALEPANDQVLNTVFKHFIRGNELIGGKKLTDEHYNYLKSRGVSDEDIIKYDFFSEPDTKIITPLINILKKEGFDIENLNRIPGFFKWKKGGNWSFSRVPGIYFPTRNYLGEINGIHRRADTVKENDSRYKWQSSNFTIYKPDLYEIGAKSGTPIDVMYPSTPKETWDTSLIIVEGKFKEIEISKHCNCVCISVQGVGNHKGIEDVIQNIEDYQDIKFTSIFIAFDADIDVNPNIFKASSSICSLISSKSDVDIFYYTWDSDNGKGIDDLIFNGYGDTLRTMHYIDFEEKYNDFLPKCTYVEFDKIKKQKITKINKPLLRKYYLNEILSNSN